jgi:hypothetical protein
MPEQQDAPYDPYIPSGQAAPQQQQGTGGNARTQALQAVSWIATRRETLSIAALRGWRCEATDGCAQSTLCDEEATLSTKRVENTHDSDNAS